ncbi:peptide chain release factor 2 [Actinoplanes lutulentus]|uniref:PCRF domain-containing protein n=1 Tax=Actinoplanes lutulentus TaxID=1287878 RepID=A0A327ZH31_9ACTN|nr:peptide chain release factor 2 [Actinoplanes lutulentus]RAK42182.1 PCRF domain-containing protein [Actinoplanes lutulentus]
MRRRLDDARQLVALAVDTHDDAVLADLRVEAEALSAAVEDLQIRMRLDGPFDLRGAVVVVRAAGTGEDAATLVVTVLRQYREWAERHGHVVALPDDVPPGSRLLEGTLVVAAPYAYGLLRAEAGRFRAGSAEVTVTVAPLVEDDDPETVQDEDVRVDLMCTRDPATASVRFTHLPTGRSVSFRNDARAGQRREVARRVLRSLLLVADVENLG